MNKKGQSALEFIMTYGWALVVLLLVISSLWFTFGGDKFFVNEKCMMGPGFLCKDFSVDEGSIKLIVKNSYGKDISSISFTYTDCAGSSDTPPLKNGEERLFTIGGCPFSNLDVFDDRLDFSYNFADSSIMHSKATSLIALIANGDSQSFGGSGNGYGSDGNTLLLYKFDESDGSVVGDSSSNGNDGTHYGNTELLLHFDGNYLDSSGNGYGGSCAGDNCPSFITSENRNGIVLDGDDDFVDYGDVFGGLIPNSIGELSVITMLNWNKTQAENPTPHSMVLGQNMPYLDYRSDGRILFSFKNSIQQLVYSDGINMLDNHSEWHDVAVTFDSALGSDNVKILLDGVEVQATNTHTNPMLFSANANMTVGDWRVDIPGNPNLNHNFGGMIDEVGIYSNAVSADQIKRMNDANKVMYGDWTDGKYGTALSFDGVDDHIKGIGNGVDLLGLGELTVEAWIYPLSPNNTQLIVTKNGPFMIALKNGFFGGRIRTENGHFGPLLVGTIPITANQWAHVAMTYNGTEVKLFVNGVQEQNLGSEKYKNGTFITDGCLNIGRYTDGGCDTGLNNYFDGLIDEVRISDYARYE